MICRFYGLSVNEIEETDYDTIDLLYSSISIIRCREALFDIRLYDYPNLDKGARASILKDLKKEAYPNELKPKEKPITTAELAKLLIKG